MKIDIKEETVRAKTEAIRAKTGFFGCEYAILILRETEGFDSIVSGACFEYDQKKRGHMKYHIYQNVVYLLKGMKEEHPQLLVFLGIETVLSVVAPVFGIYIPKISLDLVLQGADVRQIFIVLGMVGLMMTLSMAICKMVSEGKYMLYNDMRRYYQTKLFLKSLSCEYKYVESEEGQTKYQRAVETLQGGDWSATSVMVVSMMDLTVSALCFFIYSGILSGLNVFIIFMLSVLSLVSLAGTRYAQNYERNHQNQAAEYARKLRYMINTGSSEAFGKDMRLYHAGGWFTDIRSDLIGQSIKLTTKIQNRYFAAGIVQAFLLLLRDGFAYAYLIYMVGSGRITIPEFTLYFGAVTAFSGFVNQMVDSVNHLNGANIQMNAMRSFLDLAGEPEQESALQTADLKLSDFKDASIEFEDVCFSYQEGKPILDHFSLKINAGEKAALVGVNGAGKTTIVKLLCGFYQPDSGKIRIGGQDISRVRKKDLQKLFSAVFQDIYLPPFTVAENVSLQEKDHIDRNRVRDCLIQAGLWEEIAAGEKGIDTPMTKEIADGLVLSGGQQQKLLMARALYKDAPILILDEPTAALDPIAESQTYEQFHKLSSGKTALYISHRLASTRFCDKIVYLHKGKITEEGSHEQLMEYKKDYYEMFTLQSRYYQNEKEGTVDAGK